MTNQLPLKSLVLAFLLSVTGYLFTLNPALFRNDSPETITGCITLGVTHPPGYPLFNLMGRLFLTFKVGNPAMTYNFMAALLGALGVCLLFTNLWFLLSNIFPTEESKDFTSPKFIACFVASLSLAFSNGYWGDAIAAKGGVYLFQMILELALLLFFQIILFSDRPKEARFYFLVFLLILGLVNHWPSQLLLIPSLFLIWHLSKQGLKFNSERTVYKTIICLTFMVIALSLYLYLPLRSHLYPFLNFGAPYTLKRFIASVFRTDYTRIESMAAHRDTFWSTFIEKSSYISHHLSGLFHALAYIFVIGGLFTLIKKNKNLAFFCLIFLLTTIFINLFYLQVTSIELWHLDDHLLSANWVFGLFLGIGLYAFLNLDIIKKWPYKKTLLLSPTWLIVSLAPFTFFQNFSVNDQDNKFLYYGYGITALRSLPQNALYFAESDYDSFSTLYLKTVLKKRPDVHLFLTLYLDKPYGREQLTKTDPSLLRSSTVGHSLLFDLIKDNAKSRPIYSTFSSVAFSELYLKEFPQMAFEPSGLLTHIIENNEPIHKIPNYDQLRAFWNEYLQTEVNNPSPTQGILRQACASPYLSAAREERLKGHMENWDWYYTKALCLISNSKWTAQSWFDKADGDETLGEGHEAEKAYQIACYYFYRLGQLEKAVQALKKAKALSTDKH